MLLADGTSKPVEELEVGHVVVATDPQTGETAATTVAATIIGHGTKNPNLSGVYFVDEHFTLKP